MTASTPTEAPEPPFRILPQAHRAQPRLLDRRRARRAALLALLGLRLLHPPAAADLSRRACRRRWRPRRCRAGRRSRRYSINHQPWMPGPELPYVVAIVEIVEQPSVRLTTNLVNCAHEEIEIGMPVRVTFEHHADPDGDVYIPLFEPERPIAGGESRRAHRRVHQRRRPVRHRPPARPRPVGAHARRLPRRDRRTRA